MARRKRAFLDDDDSSSSDGEDGEDLDEQGYEDNDADAREERELFENPYQRNKRRRVGGKNDALYGVFADNDDDTFGKYMNRSEKKHFTQAPSFVASEKKAVLDGSDAEDEDMKEQSEEDKEEEEGGEGEDEEEDEGREEKERPVPNFRESKGPEEEEPLMDTKGIRLHPRQFTSASIPLRGGIGSGRAGLGMAKAETTLESRPTGQDQIDMPQSLSRGGIGSKKPGFEATLPSAFGASSRPQHSFLRDETGSARSSTPGTPKLSQEEKTHFNKLQNSFGARLMAKMGWQTGTGLGASGEGIVTPVETKLRPKQSMGLAFRGFKEKTAQSKAEARRRGEIISDDEDETLPPKGKSKGGQKLKSEAWKKMKKVKVKVEHQTYEQILQNAGQEAETAGIGKIYDATSGEMREVSSLAGISSASWTPSTDTTRIPEVRHNLRLIIDVAKGDLTGLAREANALEQRKKWVEAEDTRLRHKIQEEAELIARLQNVHLIVDEINAQSSKVDQEPSLEPFSPYIEKLVNEFGKEYDCHHLDEIVVGAIVPVVRNLLASWKPLQDPTLLVNIFRRWRKALKFTVAEGKQETQIDVYGAQTVKTKPPAQDLSMTPYESLMWNMWLPKVRSCINNDWSPVDADPVIQLYEAWASILPPFIRDNVLDQLVLPKVRHSIAEWQPHSGGSSLQSLVFPWLPHVGLRIDELLDDAKRKVKSLLRNWTPGSGVPEDLVAWKDVFGSSDWNSMILKYIVPKLGAILREDFKINPRHQDMTPLEQVLQWQPFLRSAITSQLLETGFFPKWLDVLYIWLIQPNASFEEIAQWYAFWKSIFSPEVLELPGVAHGFTRGLQLMNKAIELGPDAPTKLPRPVHDVSSNLPAPGSRHETLKARPIPARATEITFRSIVEEFAASNDLMFIPTGRAHEKSRMPLFRVSPNVDGKGGILVYILDDVVWLTEGDDYRAISLEEMVLKATKSR